MKTRNSRRTSCRALIAALLLVIGGTTRSADTPTLKYAYKELFYIGTAINRNIVTGAPSRAGFSNRTLEQVQTDVALVKERFNHLRNSLWLEIIGPDFIAKAFEYAHEAG